MAEVKHAIVQTELMSGTDDRSRMRSFKFGKKNTTTNKFELLDIDNGNVVELKTPMLDRDLWTAVEPTAASDLSNIALVATPEMMYDERKKELWQFYNAKEEEEACTGLLLKEGDVFSVTTEGLDAAATIVVDNIVELQAGTKLKVVASATTGSTTVGKVIDIVERTDGTYIGIRVGTK